MGTAIQPAADRSADLGRVVHLTAEYWPYVRTGGLGEAVRGLAEYQARAGIPVTVVLPLHRAVVHSGTPLEPMGDAFEVRTRGHRDNVRVHRVAGPSTNPEVWFVEHQSFDRPGVYGDTTGDYPDNHWRFSCFAHAALAGLPRHAPDAAVVHAHDWHTAVANVLLRETFGGDAFYDRLGAVLTVHNPAFQGHFEPKALAEAGLPAHLFDWRFFEWYGHVNFMKGGIAYSDMVTTVSPTHAWELTTPDGGFGLHDHFSWLGDRLVGILNGIDVRRWDPVTDPDITARYSASDREPKTRCKRALQRQFGLPQRKRTPLMVMSARLVQQKGLDLLLDGDLLARAGAQAVILGRGQPSYEEQLAALARKAPTLLAVPLDFSERLEHRLIAGGDLLLMPSQFEPCGLTQMRAQLYGTLPIVRRVGGLADTVQDGATGFTFDAFDAVELADAIDRAIETFHDRPAWDQMVSDAMGLDHSWTKAELQYRDVYRRALAARG